MLGKIVEDAMQAIEQRRGWIKSNYPSLEESLEGEVGQLRAFRILVITIGMLIVVDSSRLEIEKGLVMIH